MTIYRAGKNNPIPSRDTKIMVGDEEIDIRIRAKNYPKHIKFQALHMIYAQGFTKASVVNALNSQYQFNPPLTFYAVSAWTQHKELKAEFNKSAMGRGIRQAIAASALNVAHKCLDAAEQIADSGALKDAKISDVMNAGERAMKIVTNEEDREDNDALADSTLIIEAAQTNLKVLSDKKQRLLEQIKKAAGIEDEDDESDLEDVLENI